MPRYISPSASLMKPASNVDKNALIGQLIAELDAGKSVQPVITEEAVGEGIYITVIWDVFADLGVEDRTQVIQQAYQKADPKTAKRITNAVGFTVDEAFAMGLLPFAITPIPRRDREADKDAIAAAIKAEREKTLLGVRSSELRYPNIEIAEQAQRRLHQITESVHWVITQEVGSVADFYAR